ncbi:HNH endonuclease [Candidatus Woesearchaeota archaeon]|nr:HNH endonuclease [Candidatus Woesearchaeota archaeon]
MITKQFKLSIELVPSTIWYVNLYHHYTNNNQMEKWHRLKQYLFETEGKHCWICRKKERNLEAHEFWEYDDYKRIQKLVAVHHLCDLCHKIKHIGLWLHSADGDKMLRQQKSKKEDIINHFCKINNCSIEDFKNYEDSSFAQWKQRSKFQWKQDLGIYHPKFELKELKNQQKLVS